MMTMMRLRWLVCIGLALGMAAGAVAADPRPGAHGDSHGNTNAATGHDDHGPKPELLQWDFGTAFWSIIVFLILLVILRIAAWKPILSGLQQRERFISDALQGAKREREEAKKMMADYSAKIDASRAEASAIVEEGRRDAEALRRKIQEDAAREGQDIIARAKRDIQIARDTAIAELYDRTLDLASNVAGKIVHKQLRPEDHKSLLDESLAEMGKTANH